MDLLLLSKKKKVLSKKELYEIYKLKNSFWGFGISSQKKWFTKNVKENDINILLKNNNKIIGYALLRARTLKLSKQKLKYLLFDTLIINKSLRKKSLAKLMVNYVNITIKAENKIGILYCVRSLINYYLSMNWYKLNKKNVYLADHKLDQQPLIHNIGNKFKILKTKKITIYTNS